MNEYLVKDKFIDFEGKEHNFVIAAIKEPIDSVYLIDSDVSDIDTVEISSVLKIGVSICNPTDTFDEKLGTMKALGRAHKSTPVLCTQHSGQLTDKLIKVYIDQEIEYLKSNPEKYMKGYNKAAQNYQLKKSMDALHDSFSDFDKVVVENLKKDPTYLDNIQEYVDFWRKTNK